ncbi:uncharacterized protein LOC113509105 isoform X1 [Galleria mellonella]|uniref:Uncharacterized protein LOC113509105 isoform X1 n=1 Tax=Galleria mellonella TaxID=7137 RepID=A0A6J3BXB3_GALME|nr:uncharacterized protein LOC113509105 isoform X1 [Galleria mellonella]
MRKTSQDGGDSTSITSGIENEAKKPIVGIMKTKRNSIKRKVQNFSHESDDAIIEPLLQKDKDKTEIPNQSAKYLLSKTKTDSMGEKENDKEKLLSDNKHEKPSLSTAPSTVEGKSLINVTNENHVEKSFSISPSTIYNHMNTNIFGSSDGTKNIVSPKTQILVEIDATKQTGYSPSPLIFTTAKIHADGKAKHMEPVQVTPVPILSTIEGSVVKAASISNNENKILPVSAGKMNSCLNPVFIPCTNDSEVATEQKSTTSDVVHNNSTCSELSNKSFNEKSDANKVTQNISITCDFTKSTKTDPTTVPIKTVKCDSVTSIQQISPNISKLSENKNSTCSSTIKDISVNVQSTIDVNKNIDYANISDKKVLPDLCNLKQLQRQNNGAIEKPHKSPSDLIVSKSSNDTIIGISKYNNTLSSTPNVKDEVSSLPATKSLSSSVTSVKKSNITSTITPTTTTIVQTTPFKGIIVTSTDKTITICPSTISTVTVPSDAKFDTPLISTTSKSIMLDEITSQVQPVALTTSTTVLTSDLSIDNISGVPLKTTVSNQSPISKTTTAISSMVTSSAMSLPHDNTVSITTEDKVLFHKADVTTISSMVKPHSSIITSTSKPVLTLESSTKKPRTEMVASTGKSLIMLSENKDITTTTSAVKPPTTTSSGHKSQTTINSTTKMTSAHSPVNTTKSTVFNPTTCVSSTYKSTISDSSNIKPTVTTSIISQPNQKIVSSIGDKPSTLKTVPHQTAVSTVGGKSSTAKPTITNVSSIKVTTAAIKTTAPVAMTSSVSIVSKTEAKIATSPSSVSTVSTKLDKSSTNPTIGPGIRSEKVQTTPMISSVPTSSKNLNNSSTNARPTITNTTQVLDSKNSKMPLVTAINTKATTSISKQSSVKPKTTKASNSSDNSVKTLVSTGEKSATVAAQPSTSNKQKEKSTEHKNLKA